MLTLQVSSGCGQEASAPSAEFLCRNLSTGLLGHPHNMAPDFSQSESQVAAIVSFITQPWKSHAISCWFLTPDLFVVGESWMGGVYTRKMIITSCTLNTTMLSPGHAVGKRERK